MGPEKSSALNEIINLLKCYFEPTKWKSLSYFKIRENPNRLWTHSNLSDKHNIKMVRNQGSKAVWWLFKIFCFIEWHTSVSQTLFTECGWQFFYWEEAKLFIYIYIYQKSKIIKQAAGWPPLLCPTKINSQIRRLKYLKIISLFC